MKTEKLVIPQNLIDRNPGLGKWNIIHAYRGSYAHNTRLNPTDKFFIDDIDTMGVCVPSKDYYLGLRTFHSSGTQEIKEEAWDIVIYEAKKAISLLAGGNPNILSLLWMNENKYINVTGAGIDSFSEASGYGISLTTTFNRGDTSAHTRAYYNAVSTAMHSHAATGTVDYKSFTDTMNDIDVN